MPAERNSAPPLVATIGMHGSASTWVFNVARELLIAAAGDAEVHSLYADERAQVPEWTCRHLVIKSHRGSEGLDDWLAASGACILLSVRDPRDACMSMAQRFRSPLAHAIQWISQDCERLQRLAHLGHPLFQYEDRFFDDRETVKQVAGHLGLRPSAAQVDDIFARYTTDAVRAFSQSLSQLPAERLTTVIRFPMDRVTQILAPHIGDTCVGKWLDLPISTQDQLTRVFRPFLDRFSYPC